MSDAYSDPIDDLRLLGEGFFERPWCGELMRFNCQLSIYTALVFIVRLMHQYNFISVINRKKRKIPKLFPIFIQILSKENRRWQVFILDVPDLYPFYLWIFLFIKHEFFYGRESSLHQLRYMAGWNSRDFLLTIVIWIQTDFPSIKM